MITELNLNQKVGSSSSGLENWKDIQNLSQNEQVAYFHEALSANDYQDVKRGFRNFAAHLLEQGRISMAQYVSIFGGHAIHTITQDSSGSFRDMKSGVNADSLVHIYSQAKYGSIEDIRCLAKMIISKLSQALDTPTSHWYKLFSSAKEQGDSVVMMTTGWRNVPSAANVLYDIVVEHINLKLAHLGFPTIINVKLPRIAPPCENYASLTTEERERVNLVQDHVIPDRNFYLWSGVHVIFGDDVLVTGSTADKVFFESMRNGAKSFQAIYPVAIDPTQALQDAKIEERLNMVKVKGELDPTLAKILSNPDYLPILRTLRLVFSNCNYQSLKDFLPLVPSRRWMQMYTSALGNEFLQQEDCKPSLLLVRDYLTSNGLLSSDGMDDSL